MGGSAGLSLTTQHAMKKELILLVAGLAVVAAIPVQESVASTPKEDLLKLILNGNPEENDIFGGKTDEVPVAALTIPTDEVAPQADEVKETTQPQAQQQDSDADQTPPQEEEHIEGQDLPNKPEQTHTEDPPKVEPASPPQELQQQDQDEVLSPEQPIPDVMVDVSPTEEQDIPKPQPVLVNTKEDLHILPVDFMGNEGAYLDAETGYPIEPDNDYVVLDMEEEPPSEDEEGTFKYGFLSDHDSFDQEFPPEPQDDVISFDPEPEPQIEAFPVDHQPNMDSLPYDSEGPFGQEEGPVATDMDNEQIPWFFKEHDYEYDYDGAVDTHDPNPYINHEDDSLGLLDWLVPDILHDEPSDYDESYDAKYYEAPMIDDPYLSDIAEWEEHKDSDSPNEEIFPVDDGLIHGEHLEFDHEEVDQDPADTMPFEEVASESNPPDDEHMTPWSIDTNQQDQTGLLKGDEPMTIFETEPTQMPDFETSNPFYSPLAKVMRENVMQEPIDTWNNGEPSMMNSMPESDSLFEYFSDPAEEIMEDHRGYYDNYAPTPLMGSFHNIERQPPMTWYPEENNEEPYWAPYRILNRPVRKIYYSFIDEVPREKYPRSFGIINDNEYSFQPRYHQQTAVNRDPFSFTNEIDDDMPPQIQVLFAKPLRKYKFNAPDFSSSDMKSVYASSPRFSLKDFLLSLSPSYYTNTYSYDNQRQSPMYNQHSYSPFLKHDGPSEQHSFTSPPPSYSSRFNSLEGNDYLTNDNYYPNRMGRLPSYERSEIPSGIFPEDTMSKLYSRKPKLHHIDYSDDYPFRSSSSYSSPRSLSPMYESSHYTDNSFNRPKYSRSYSTPMYSRYAPMFY